MKINKYELIICYENGEMSKMAFIATPEVAEVIYNKYARLDNVVAVSIKFLKKL